MHDSTVLLFYKEYERDTFFRNDRYLKRAIRPLYNKIRPDQAVSGFYVWYLNLVQALRQEGYQVITNNYALARKYPNHPVGLVGYPILLDHWDLPNPAILGPGMYDHPGIAPRLMEDERYKRYIVTCQWMQDLFAPVYGASCALWYAGIDTTRWADTQQMPKTVDVLVYDKIRWEREHYEPELLEPILAHLRKRNLSYQIIRYKHYKHSHYRELLAAARSMIFLCEHETQGLAYQEALASNVPILAWDNGYWRDPQRTRYTTTPLLATSVPYFSHECGERFRDSAEFASSFDTFWEKLPTYQPRRYVERELSLKGSAQLYMRYYASLMPVSV